MSVDEALTIVSGALLRLDARVKKLEDCCESSKEFTRNVQPVIQFVQQAFLNNQVGCGGQCSHTHSTGDESGAANGGDEEDPIFTAFERDVTETLGERSNNLNS